VNWREQANALTEGALLAPELEVLRANFRKEVLLSNALQFVRDR
jgi:hypothetical protein